MRYSIALFAGIAAAGYIPDYVPSSSAAPTSSAKGYYDHDYVPKPSSTTSSSTKGYGDYWPKSSSSVKAPYVPKSSSAPYKPTYTTIECEVSNPNKNRWIVTTANILLRAQPPSPMAPRPTLPPPRPPGSLSALTSHMCQSQSQSSQPTSQSQSTQPMHQPSQHTPHRHPSPRLVLSRSLLTLPSTTLPVPVLLLPVSSVLSLTSCKRPRTARFVSNALGLFVKGLGVPRLSTI